MTFKLTPAQKLFEAANDLWFDQGYVAQALARYQAAVAADPADPVAWYQLAQVLWACGHFDQAKQALAASNQQRARLSPLGQTKLDQLHAKFAALPHWRLQPVADADMDIERLAQRTLSAGQWLDIGLAAKERELIGVAAQAFANGVDSSLTADWAEEMAEMEYAADLQRALLAEMRIGTKQATVDVPSSAATTLATTGGAPPTLPSTPAKTPSAGVIGTPPALPQVTTHPLRLEIAVTPAQSKIGAETTLTVTLINSSASPIAVNKRLQLNHRQAPPGYGEIFVNVQGPPGYQNQTRFQIRSGPPAAADFTQLPPGAQITETYRLWRYESLQLLGGYRVWVTYQNVVAATLQGRTVFTGVVESAPITLIKTA